MIQELFWKWSAKTTALARELGFDREFSRYKARFSRNKASWQPHLEASRNFIRHAVASCPGRDLVVVAGSGMCLDIPLKDLSGSFRRVVLADMVHPREIAQSARQLGNVHLLHCDLTGTLQDVADSLRAQSPLALEPLPQRARGRIEGELSSLGTPDLVISANTLAQLPLIPMERLWATGLYRDHELEQFAKGVIAAHLAWLHALPCPACLLTDLTWLALGVGEAQTTDPLYGSPPGEPSRRWEWRIAPRPEAHPSRDIVHLVGAFLLPHSG